MVSAKICLAVAMCLGTTVVDSFSGPMAVARIVTSRGQVAVQGSTTQLGGGRLGINHGLHGRSTKARHLSQGNLMSVARGGPQTEIYNKQSGLGLAENGVRDRRRKLDDGRGPDFEINLGKVIESLRQDFPLFFLEPPNFDIYTKEIVLCDPTGVVLTGLNTYKRLFATLRFFKQVLMKDVQSRFRVTYDWSKQQVRMNWNMVILFKARQKPVYVDGISVYQINNSGMVSRHDVETIVVNGKPVEPPFAYAWINLPDWVSQPQSGKVAVPQIAPQFNFHLQDLEDVDTVLPSMNMVEASDNAERGGETSFSLESQSRTEDVKATERTEKQPNNEWGFPKMEIPNGCETSWDCSGDQVCCDFLLVKMCCSNGIRQPIFTPATIPIPVRDAPPNHGGRGGNRGGW